MRYIFIAGTDTSVGKTIITGLLARFLLERGFSVITQKWIQTGFNFPKDLYTHLKIMKKSKDYIKNYIDYVSLYNFKFPSSPHLASKLENRKINIYRIKNSLKKLIGFDYVIIEGIGGLCVPLNRKITLIDLLCDLKLPVIIVAKNKLGVINHALLSISELKRRNIKILGIIFNNPKFENELILKDNPEIIKEISKEKVFGVLPYNKDIEKLYSFFIPIGERIYKCIV